MRNLPYDTELSEVAGVSIKQVKSQRFEATLSSLDTENLRTAKAENVPLEDLLYKWVDFSGWVFVDAELPECRYDIRVDAPEGTTNLEQIKRAFESVFGLAFTEKTESIEVWVLEKAAEEPRGLEPVEAKNPNWGTASTPGGFGYEFRAGAMEDLAEVLGRYLEGGIVFDETGLEGYYRFVLSMDHWEPKTAAPAVGKLGLRVTRAKRDLPVLRIDYAEILKSTLPEPSGQ